MVARRFDVYLVNVDPTAGSEIKKTRPCLIVSPDELNRHLATLIIAPMTTKGRTYPTHVPCVFDKKVGEIALDQLRTTDRTRLVKRLGRIDKAVAAVVLARLAALFAPRIQASRGEIEARRTAPKQIGHIQRNRGNRGATSIFHSLSMFPLFLCMKCSSRFSPRPVASPRETSC